MVVTYRQKWSRVGRHQLDEDEFYSKMLTMGTRPDFTGTDTFETDGRRVRWAINIIPWSRSKGKTTSATRPRLLRTKAQGGARGRDNGDGRIRVRAAIIILKLKNFPTVKLSTPSGTTVHDTIAI